MTALDTFAASLRARDAELRSTSHLHARVAESRRFGGRGSGRRGGGGAPGYNPLGSSKLIETWLSYAGTTDDGAGLISNWTGQKAGKAFTAATTKRPTLTAAQFGAVSGLVFDGSSDSMSCATVGALISGQTGVTVIIVGFAPGDLASRALLEYSASWFATAGVFVLDKVSTYTLYAACRGNVGNSVYTCSNNTVPMTFAGVMSATFDFTLAAAETSPRLDNVLVAGSMTTESNNTSTMGNHPLYLGSRAGTSLFAPLTVGAVAIYQTLTDAELTIEARGLGAIFGGIVVA